MDTKSSTPTVASTLGILAFHAGRSSVPACDSSLMKMVANNPDKRIGASLSLLDAWAKGWHSANLNR